jgi:glycosyltransferase involved in cell wall biosynthesis
VNEPLRANRPEVAFVVQRYGLEVTGGSESLARAVAERLLPDYRITVFTTCARDYVSWRNELPEGGENLNGVEVLRFPSQEERNLDAFNRFAEPLYVRQHSRQDEIEFLRRQGPEVPGLVEALDREKGRFAAIVFFTYLYYPTYWGLRAAPERAILVPTTHDEPPLGLGIYREVFALPKALGFLTAAEEALVRSRFEVGSRPAWVAGMGVEVPASPDLEGFRRRATLPPRYALYAGRIDAGKGCAEMLGFFQQYRQAGRAPLDMVLIGKLAMKLPEGVRYLGFLSEQDKAAAIAGAEVVLCPSPYESLSIALLEGFALGVPAMVNARSPVLLDHCLRSNGGLYYENGEEFVEALGLLSGDPSLRKALGDSGRRYVGTHYRWDAVLARYRQLIQAVGSLRA